MKKYIQAYMRTIREFIEKELPSADASRINEVLKEFELKIAYFQHERFIHLIVTVLFALLEMMAVFTFFISLNLSAMLFAMLFLILLVPYIMHYYFLENSVQEMYRMRDEIVSSLQPEKP